MSEVGHGMLAQVGWAATAVFTASYLFQRAEVLRGVQMVGATLWILYGVAIDARPVVVANVLLLAAATLATLRPRVQRMRRRSVDDAGPRTHGHHAPLHGGDEA